MIRDLVGGVPLKIGFIGGGKNSAVGRAHYAAINLDNIFELEAGCFSRNSIHNFETAQEYQVPINRTYDSIQEFVSNEAHRLDAVVVLTPTDQHFLNVIQLLKAKIPVICEKSLTTSFKEAVSIHDVLIEEDGFLSVIFNYTGYPMVRELKAMVNHGDLGTLKRIQIEMPQEGFMKKNVINQPLIPQSWRLVDGKVPTISLDLGVHLHSLIQFISGNRVESVAANERSIGNFKNIVDDVSGTAFMQQDLVCDFWFSKAALGYRNGLQIRVFGSKGSVVWIQENPEQLHFTNQHGEKSIVDPGHQSLRIASEYRYQRFKAGHPAGFIEALANYYKDISVDLISFSQNSSNGKSAFNLGIHEAKAGLIFLEAVTKSSREMTRVTLDEYF